MDRLATPASVDPARDSIEPLDWVDFTTVGICRPACGTPMPRRPASRHFTVAGNGRFVRANFRSCLIHITTAVLTEKNPFSTTLIHVHSTQLLLLSGNLHSHFLKLTFNPITFYRLLLYFLLQLAYTKYFIYYYYYYHG